MLDQMLDVFERDRRSSASPKGGLRGKLGAFFDSEPDDSNRDRDRRRSRHHWDDDRSDDHDRHAHRSKRREHDVFDFGN